MCRALEVSVSGDSAWRKREPRLATAPFEYIETFDNRTRRHSTLQYMSPVMYEQLMS